MTSIDTVRGVPDPPASTGAAVRRAAHPDGPGRRREAAPASVPAPAVPPPTAPAPTAPPPVGEPTDPTVVVGAAYDALAAHDVEALFAVLDPWVEWITTEGGPCGGSAVGILDVVDVVLVPSAADWSTLDMHPDRVVATGSEVVVVGTYVATARGTDRTVHARFAHLWDVQDGRVVRVEIVSDSALLNRTLLGTPRSAPPS